MEKAEEDKEKDQITLLYDEFITPLGEHINGLFTEYERDRRLVEERWIKDLRQYRGEYDPKTRKKLHPKRSKAFLSLTRTKVKTVSARETDLLFPANGDKNWGIRPTPVPELNPAIIESISLQYQEQTGEQPDEPQVRKWLSDEAKIRADAMEKEMADQLSELKYRHIIRQTIFDGNLYGTGILKGPMTKTTAVKR
ncbi:MAG: hypothetical protein GWN00_21095, partial [Aliifodinibius sp.]|nr:hypothetical protein [Fodinibius sp.]NIY27211.1 hypothetical protein [Fodinibius sp.]